MPGIFDSTHSLAMKVKWTSELQSFRVKAFLRGGDYHDSVDYLIYVAPVKSSTGPDPVP
jgi:hypothetical protein